MQLWSWLVCPSHRARAGSAAAYLIGGGCSNDSFMDFRAGLIALGRDWYEKATADPDSLADHPAVIAAAAVHNERLSDQSTLPSASLRSDIGCAGALRI
ncbi:DUF4240 domain-containing protein [Streptomyces sp. NPDC060235]|uniref:DUF4240 domain-containing protein n=1 Tax=Streptomyces sp. NPDC060235 TaxID=3347080 RepID=UPI0036672FA5